MAMRIFIAAILAATVIAIGAMVVLDTVFQRQAYQAFSSPTNVRLSEEAVPHSVVDKDWSAVKTQ
jgi:hypothetical protein